MSIDNKSSHNITRLLEIDTIRKFVYDPLYRIKFATGRESHEFKNQELSNESLVCGNYGSTRPYKESYEYDDYDNTKEICHDSLGKISKRTFTIEKDSNHLTSISRKTSYEYSYDKNGNIIKESSARTFDWDNKNQLCCFNVQKGNEPTIHALYLYDSKGQRIKKVVRNHKNSHYKSVTYVDGVFEHYKKKGYELIENNLIKLALNERPLADIRVGTPFKNDKTRAVKYNFIDYANNVSTIIDDERTLISHEELTPFGETVFGKFSRKRFRFAGKERDEESGLYYFGMRYYSPFLSRWISTDPKGFVDGFNLYEFVRSNPITLVDDDGFVSHKSRGYAGSPKLRGPVPKVTEQQAAGMKKIMGAVGGLIAGEFGNAAEFGWGIGKAINGVIHDDFDGFVEGMRDIRDAAVGMVTGPADAIRNIGDGLIDITVGGWESDDNEGFDGSDFTEDEINEASEPLQDELDKFDGSDFTEDEINEASEPLQDELDKSDDGKIAEEPKEPVPEEIINIA
ncbi:MAG: RHS repeat-associated core domain-containing protein [Nitrosopumilus sp.]|nr:RHS repeat-associated core domain-containing protein [Nitrosopumilus sp.]